MVEGRSLSVSGSIGVALYPRDGRDYDELIRLSDAAMYRAKGQGRGTALVHALAAGQGAPQVDGAPTTTSP
jgi:GGDEF domain-containing protein